MFDKRNAGKPFTPNGMGGISAFASYWCSNCTRYRGGDVCAVLQRVVIGKPTDEWTHNAIGQPICTAFDPLPDYQQWQMPRDQI